MSDLSKYLQLERELKQYREILNRASVAMRDNEVSNYPIFVAHKQEVELGLKLIEQDNEKFLWSINISSLEEFVAKQVIVSEKLEEFKKVFKKPDDQLCIFVISELGAAFVYLPI